jgi:hypothetical protein
MMIKKIIVLLSFNIIALAAFSQQQRYQEDSVKVNSLVSDKLKTLKSSGVTSLLYLFSDAGSLVMMYELNGKIKGEKACYKGNRESKFKNLKISKEDKLNFSKCIDIAPQDTVVSFSNCKDFVHSFNRIGFVISANGHAVQGSFTSDCASALEKNGMMCLFNIYKNLVF